jgi:hypothetical protein
MNICRQKILQVGTTYIYDLSYKSFLLNGENCQFSFLFVYLARFLFSNT